MKDNRKCEKFISYKISSINWLKWFLLFPAVYVIVILMISLLKLFSMSLFDENGFTLKHFVKIFSEPVYTKVIGQTFVTAFYAMVLSVILAYPIAYLSSTSKRKIISNGIDTIMMVVFCTSILVRNFALIIVLQNNGIINTILLRLNLISEPLKLVYNTFGIVVGLVSSLIPYAYLSLTAVMKRIDGNLILASYSLGGKKSKSFLKIYLPLSKQGIFSGALIVFVLALGFYITPTLLGGANSTMVSVLIQNNVNTTLNWNLASALSVVMFIITLSLMIVIFRFFGAEMFFAMDEKEDNK